MPSKSDRRAQEIAAALSAPQASIAPKYFYDATGSALFERITHLPEYYLTRTERSIMEAHGRAMARRIAPATTVVELGAGNCEKARALCAMIKPRRFIAIDISAEFLRLAAAGLRRACPAVDIRPLVADLGEDIRLPADLAVGERLVFFPGSSIGNYDPQHAAALLSRIRRLAGDTGALLIGVDLVKDSAVLEAAYNDAAGVTAAFNLNVLLHLNQIVGTDFDPGQWEHQAFFNRTQSRVEMHLEAQVDLRVTWPGGERVFRRGERIHTENSYKYGIETFAALLGRCGFSQNVCWTDPREWFAVFLARP